MVSGFFRYAFRIILGVFLVAAVLGATLYFILLASLPSFDGNMTIAGMDAATRIVRDENAVPHVEAKTRADAMRALGYLHASDRMWQMEVTRMAAQGRLSEMFGEATKGSDIFLRTVGIGDSARASFDRLRLDTRELLEAYAEGVNAWLNRERGLIEPRLPVEFMVLGHDPEPWQAWQCVAAIKIMAVTLGHNMDDEIVRLALIKKGFNGRQISDILPESPRDNLPLLPNLGGLYGFDGVKKAGISRPFKLAEGMPEVTEPAWPIQVQASNNWAVSGSRTDTGMPLLANDPHLGLTSPSPFYLAHVQFTKDGRTRNLVGGTLPGAPLFLVGRNDRVAWGLTTTNLDSQDLFLEKVDPDNPGSYRTPEGSVAFKNEEIRIRVKGEEDFVFTRRSTRHGPVLPDTYRKLGELLPENTVAALSWVALAEDDTTVDGVFDLSLSDSVIDFFEATRSVVAPMQNIAVADVNGNIGLIAPGRIPIREDYNLIQGRAPAPGWIGTYDWQGFQPFNNLPRLYNPEKGALATANAKWMPPQYKTFISADWAEHFRQARAEELFVDDGGKHSMKTMAEGQADRLSRAYLQFRDEAIAQLPQGVRINEGVTRSLMAWNGMMDGDRPEPLILSAWHRYFNKTVFADDLGEYFSYAPIANGNLTRAINILTTGGSRNWCDRIDTSKVETCGDALFQSLETALSELSKEYGNDWTKWRWAAAHASIHEHRPFSKVTALSPYFTITRDMQGGPYTLMRAQNHYSEKSHPYATVHASAFRGIYDLSNMEDSLYIISTGQSGNVMSPYYDSMVADWAAVKYVKIPSNAETYGKQALGTFTLHPEQSR
ncbi:MAG: penicillin acylase family protein [Nitratireductor sp.]|nr:penicillin acylase family protein [Nitratireductor sp.]